MKWKRPADKTNWRMCQTPRRWLDKQYPYPHACHLACHVWIRFRFYFFIFFSKWMYLVDNPFSVDFYFHLSIFSFVWKKKWTTVFANFLLSFSVSSVVDNYIEHNNKKVEKIVQLNSFDGIAITAFLMMSECFMFTAFSWM